MSVEVPAPQFQHFERVVTSGDGPRCRAHLGERGTIVWLESYAVRNAAALDGQWRYLVHLTTGDAWKSFAQSDLESTGEFDQESAHLGRCPEISFDLVLEEDNDFMEGSYRLPGEFWKVVIFRKEDVPEVVFQQRTWQTATEWERDIAGLVIRLPQAARMGRRDLLRALSQAVGFDDWVQVEGPDSMMLR